MIIFAATGEAFAELFGVRTAWYRHWDISPVGVAVNLHIDMSITNLGIQERKLVNDAQQEVFPSCQEIDLGYAYLSNHPCLGVDIALKEAAKCPVLGELQIGPMHCCPMVLQHDLKKLLD